MSHFYGSMIGSRGEATRCGTPSSGIWAHVRGWNLGIEVCGQVIDGHDNFVAYATTGSDGTGRRIMLGILRLTDLPGEYEFVPTEDQFGSFDRR